MASVDLDRRIERWAESLRAADRLDMVATVAEQVVGFIGGGPPRRQEIPAGVEISNSGRNRSSKWWGIWTPLLILNQWIRT